MNRKTKIGIVVLLTLVVTALVMSWKAIPQGQAYHNFCDQRLFLGVPNFWNVTSNLGFLVVGVLGLRLVSRSEVRRGLKQIHYAVFTGILLTGFGSAFYHYHPDNASLVYDRLPMTLVFMGMAGAVMEESIGGGVGVKALLPLLGLGFFSVWWWHYTESAGAGDLRLYVLVQYYPMVFIPLVLLLFPSGAVRRGWRPLLLCFGCYGLAKVAESLDCRIYSLLGWISGHTVKHLLAALATWFLVVRFSVMQKYNLLFL